MKSLFSFTFFLFCTALNISFALPPNIVPYTGQQPQLAVDNAGIIRLIYGQEDKIYCATSLDNGISFKESKLVGAVKQMHLGMSRGPQVASSKNYTLVAAIDKKGVVHIFQLNHATNKWKEESFANDEAGSAPEGLMSIAADKADNFYCVWLDNRTDKYNKICFAKTTDKGTSWTKNRMVYKSADKTVCECCKPSIVVSDSKVVIMFRNWLNGSRDLYLLQSADMGNSFASAVKLGTGTWKLNGCPMDGGGLVVTKKAKVTTVWRREGTIYYSKPGEGETKIGQGRNCSITDPQKPVITWQDEKHLKMMELATGKVTDAGEGTYIKAVRTKDNKLFCAWEHGGSIILKRI